MVQITQQRASGIWKEPVAGWTAGGLFAAPWTDPPASAKAADAGDLPDHLDLDSDHRNDIAAALGHLLEVRSHCLQAAAAREYYTCRQEYAAALKACEAALFRLHSCEGEAAAALTEWALGVHALIRAQMTMPKDPAAARGLALSALTRLDGKHVPLTAGAEADAEAAARLVRETAELEERLLGLCDRVRQAVDAAEQAVERRLAALNRAVASMRRQHAKALAWAVGWGALNLILMAAAPVNALVLPAVPWSVPFIVALPVLWWATWARPFRDGRLFFGYVTRLRTAAVAAARTAAEGLWQPDERLEAELAPVLDAGLADYQRLRRFCLFRVPEQFDTCWKARAIREGALMRLAGTWLADMIDQAAQPLAEVLETPERIPYITAVRFGPLR
ncbi:hypothetical protein J2Z79_000478 [Symbiobacterium terraclitae]|uniref:Uncharacterized protein n=1 Tax=Symbiobacterium terraclitae TaxID=557451 RepID=A0ABS4JRM5_9FIRM|nr:hypothetical protein [Symbiobacterium terraclitae]MBP2017104.1 hypothetical protein [Symbiobacterium terraclitae]